MTPERFQQIEELYHAAREKTGLERAALLAQTDPELRREVERMLAVPDNGEFLKGPLLDAPGLLDPTFLDPTIAYPTILDPTMTVLAPGASLGPYRIERKLGEGGMGQVFRAIDTRLGRAVAVKTTHERFSSRFEREARAISSLNHPNVCTLYDVGPAYLVMELVEGDTLATLLKSGPLPLELALTYVSQIVSALAEAHSKGVIHRDLKPGNIMIARSGVKVLDFGLAKSNADETLTASRMILGTPAYMAPEQRDGKPADARSDIYSFGCVLHEMVTGVRVSIQRKQMPSRKLEKIVSRCLETDPDQRWQSASELQQELSQFSTSRIPWRMVAIAAGLLILAAGTYAYYHSVRPAPALADTDTIVLADFENKTGDPVFDDALRQGLAIELQQSPFLSLISDGQVRSLLPLMGQPKDARLTPELAGQICERTASAAVLEGSIASLGSQYVLGLRARSCESGAILDQEQVQAARREDVLNALSEMGRAFRAKAGESLATLERHSTPLVSATTASPEALKALSTAMKVVLAGGQAPAIPHLLRAVEIDPNFAMAYAQLGMSYSSVGESVLSAESTTKAWQLRDRVSDRERFFIDFTYQRQVTGNLEKAYEVLESWNRTYPRISEQPNPQGLLGGISTQGTGRFERAIEAANGLVAQDPSVVFGYSNLAAAYFFLGRFEDSKRAIQRAFDRKLEMPELLRLRYNIAILENDGTEMDRIQAAVRGKAVVEHTLAYAQAIASARNGHLQAARQLSDRAVNLALQEGKKEEAAAYKAGRAVWEATCGNPAAATQLARAALEISQGRDIQFAGGLALALSGDPVRAESIARDLEKRFPEDTFARFTYVPLLRGSAALRRGQYEDSVSALTIADRYELAVTAVNFSQFYFGGLYTALTRGQAQFGAKHYADAAAEFQKILDHPGIVNTDPIGLLAYVYLGRSFAQSGDVQKAKSAYQKFLALWEHADPDIPILKQAQAEYRALR